MSLNVPLEHLSGRLRIIPLFFKKVPFFLHSLVDTRPDLPANDCGRAIFQSSSQRTEAERGDSLQPVPMPVYPRQRWSISPHAKQLRTSMIPSWWRHYIYNRAEVKGQRSHRPLWSMLCINRMDECLPLWTVPVRLWRSLQGASVIKDKVSAAGWGQDADLPISALLFLLHTSDILINATLSCCCLIWARLSAPLGRGRLNKETVRHGALKKTQWERNAVHLCVPPETHKCFSLDSEPQRGQHKHMSAYISGHFIKSTHWQILGNTLNRFVYVTLANDADSSF